VSVRRGILAAAIALALAPAHAAKDPASGITDTILQLGGRLIDRRDDIAVFSTERSAAFAGAIADRLRERGVARSVDVVKTPEALDRAGYEVAILVDEDGGAARITIRRIARNLWIDIVGEKRPEAVEIRFKSPLIAAKSTGPTTPATTTTTTTTTTTDATPTKPAKPRRIYFRQQKHALDLGAPLLALASGDVDADGEVELVALTTREIVVVAVADESCRTETRLTLPGDPPAIKPRDPIGALLVADVTGDGVPEILARSSELDGGVVVGLRDGSLARQGSFADYPAVVLRDPGGAAHVGASRLSDGVNYFSKDAFDLSPAWKGFVAPALPERFLTIEGLELPGRTLLGVVDEAGELRLHEAGAAAPWVTIADVGAAFELADLDGDGDVEVIASSAKPPGDGDSLTIHSIAPDASARIVHRGSPLRGGVAAIASGDFDGDGWVDVIAAVRLVGATRSDLWILE
jgi:hypothetical protein